MQTPGSLLSLIDEGIVEQVLRPLMSGKEAQVYLVRSEGELRVAKVYKEAQRRNFRQRAEYAEGRNVRSSRDQRAMAKRTRHGREQDEAAWRSAEVSTIHRLRAAGVRVPTPYHFIDGVLIMELIVDAEGHPAPRLGDLNLDRARATEVFERVLAEVIGMLAAGVVHGDLSDFNVLMGVGGPVIIDFPQAVDASSNRNARKLLLRDVDNLHRFLSRFIPGRKPKPYAEEMWELYERGELTADAKLTGNYRPTNDGLALTDEVLALIAEAERDERRERERRGLQTRGGATQGTSASRGGQRPQSRPAPPAQSRKPGSDRRGQAPAPGGRGSAPAPGGRGSAPSGGGPAPRAPGGGRGPARSERGSAPAPGGRGSAPAPGGRGSAPSERGSAPGGRGPAPSGGGPAARTPGGGSAPAPGGRGSAPARRRRTARAARNSNKG